jgi:replication factor C subunit 3/5
MPWVEKYRPEQLNDVISHGPILETIDKLISCGGMPHLLLHGPPGTGKTSTALAIARRLNGDANFKQSILELNASDERGIDTVRDKIKTFASAHRIIEGAGGIKLVILDECDAMTRIAQFALRRVMEMHAKTTRFIIIANYVNKIIPALQSRCTCFSFWAAGRRQRLSASKWLRRMKHCHLPLMASNMSLRSPKAICACALTFSKLAKLHTTLSMRIRSICTGVPRPDDIKVIIESLLGDNFETAQRWLLTFSWPRSFPHRYYCRWT